MRFISIVLLLLFYCIIIIIIIIFITKSQDYERNLPTCATVDFSLNLAPKKYDEILARLHLSWLNVDARYLLMSLAKSLAFPPIIPSVYDT
jgi:hypothetical protein